MEVPEKLRTVQFAFASAIRAPEVNESPFGVERRRIDVYRELFYNNFHDFVSASFPVTRTLFSDGEWDGLIRRFMVEHRCHSPLFADIPLEFMDFILNKVPELLATKPFLLELMHYEWIEVAVWMADEENEAAVDAARWQEWRPVLSSVAQVLAYQFPVHQISDMFQPLEAPETPTCLVVYRWQDDVHFMVLTPATYAILQGMDGKTTYADILGPIAKQLGTDIESLQNLAEPVIRTLCERGIILGSYPSA
ncbi:MAG: DUF2063 domain-containing protein [Gammaproteobacteria bacterium]|nr:MAG: DUF2063 domain-containing protein [Gammaproteobacteria bacterium]